MPICLLVDFRSVLARMATNVLRSAGYEVTMATTDEQDLTEVDVVLLEAKTDADVADRVMKLRQTAQYHDIPILAIGEHSAQASIDAALSSGATDHYYLPLDPQSLPLKLEQMLQPAGSSQQVDVNIMNPFVSATADVLETMAGMEITRKNLFLKKDQRMFGDISGVIGLSGKAVGFAAISFPEALAKKIVAKMLSEEPDKVPMDDVRDGVGECINMIAGGAKAALSDTKYHFRLSIPTVVEGHGHEISHRKSTPCIVIVFDAEGDEFALQISLAPNNKDTRAGGK